MGYVCQAHKRYYCSLTETKLDESFRVHNLLWKDIIYVERNGRNGRGVLIIVKEHIPCRVPGCNRCREKHLDGIFLELNFRKNFIYFFVGYNFNKSNIDVFLKK